MMTFLTSLIAPKIDRNPPPVFNGVAIAGETSRASGLGEGARLILRGLEHARIPHWQIDIGGLLPAHTVDFTVASEQPPAGLPLIIHVNPLLLPWVLFRLPRALVRGRRIIGYWVWELPTAPPEWQAATPFVHEVWVPSAFVAGAAEPLLPGRVRVVPYPMAASTPKPSALDRTAFGLPDAAIVVLVAFNLASSFERKNPLAAISAFRSAFGDRGDRILLIKIGNPTHAPDDFARIVDAVRGTSNVRLETRTFSSADLHALTNVSDIVLSLHRSEGFGLVLAEAMLLCKPVIATGWSGNMTFMDAESAALVDYRLIPAQDPRDVYFGAHWADPDQAVAIAHLRRLADDAGARTALGARAEIAATERLGTGQLVAALRSAGLSAR
jgi:glycosyltransferase involved in cell wall biosynthesis